MACRNRNKNKLWQRRASVILSLWLVIIKQVQRGCHALSPDLLIRVGRANLPADVPKIRSCRINAFLDKEARENNKKTVLKRPQKSFVNAEAAVRGDMICVVAKERFPPFSILGTADVSSKPKLDGTYLIQNVFVAPEARGRGLAKRLVQGVEQLVRQKEASPLSDDDAAGITVSLNVETSNTPAVSLYKKCDFEAKGVDAALLAAGR